MNNFLTVEQLINELKKYPQDLQVLVDGYEGGLDAVVSTVLVDIEYDESKAWYYGPFEESDSSNTKAIKLISTRGQRV